jgi:hypothetical protein
MSTVSRLYNIDGCNAVSSQPNLSKVVLQYPLKIENLQGKEGTKKKALLSFTKPILRVFHFTLSIVNKIM